MQQLKNTTKNAVSSPFVLDDIRKFTSIIRKLERELSLSSKRSYKCCGITLAQCHFLVEISENPGSSLSYLAGQLNTDKSALSRTADSLLSKGLIKRMEFPEDRRSIQLNLTRAGKEKVKGINILCDDYYKNFLENSGYTNLNKLSGDVNEFTEKLSVYSKNNRCSCSE